MASTPAAAPLSDSNNSAMFNTQTSQLSSFTDSFDQSVDFLPVDQAFQVNAWTKKSTSVDKPDSLFINWNVAPGYYLYKHRFAFTQADSTTTIPALIPDGKAKQDEYFGAVEVYYNQVTIELAANIINTDKPLLVNFQGCADAGLCYTPQTLYLQRHNQTVTLSATPPQNNSIASIETTDTSSLGNSFTAILANAQLGSIIGLFFLAGLALTFTPCVLPMIPILSSIVLGQTLKPSRLRAFSLSLTYVLAMASTYALAGMLTGYFGARLNLQLQLQSPLIIIIVALLFVVFALAMLGVFELRLPNALQNRLQNISQKQRGGTYAGVALIGVISTLIVSPCVTAPLAGALVFISSTGDPTLGGVALLALGLGMGLPLLLIGTFGTQLLPKSGQWMNRVKVFFGILLLGLAIWMLDRVMPPAISLVLWIALFTGYAVHLGALKLLRGKRAISAAPLIGIALISYSALLIFNATQGHFNPATPLRSFSEPAIHLDFKSADNLQALQQILREQSNTQIVMLDLYADWCVSCQILEQQVFTSPKISKQLQQLTLIRADITTGSKDHQALLKHFGLFGPPSLLFFSNQQELRNQRIQGEITANELHQHLSRLLKIAIKEAAKESDTAVN
ncbi:MAG: protein-disulfide reductase DsbD [Pseudomonadales bacterium]